jgi:hypothetical protein
MLQARQARSYSSFPVTNRITKNKKYGKLADKCYLLILHYSRVLRFGKGAQCDFGANGNKCPLKLAKKQQSAGACFRNTDKSRKESVRKPDALYKNPRNRAMRARCGGKVQDFKSERWQPVQIFCSPMASDTGVVSTGMSA